MKRFPVAGFLIGVSLLMGACSAPVAPLPSCESFEVANREMIRVVRKNPDLPTEVLSAIQYDILRDRAGCQ